MEGEQVQSTQQAQGRVQRRGSFIGTGCLVQAAGIVLGVVLIALIPLVGWVLGPLVGLGALIAGGRMAVSYECSVCRNPVASQRVRLCPTCGAALK